MTTNSLIPRLILLVSGLSLPSFAASPVVSDFSGAGDWEGTATLETGAWNLENGEARLTFFSTAQEDFSIPVPDAGILSLSQTSGGSFTGNYDTAEVSAIGFRFMAPSQLPSRGMVVLEWGNTNAVFLHTFHAEQTGVWLNFSASLESPEGWTPLKGSIADFPSARKNVSHIAIRVTRTGVTERDFVVDDLYIATRPSTALITATNNSFTLHAEHVLKGVDYRVESASNLKGPWSLVRSVKATNQLHSISITNDAPLLFLRFRLP